MISLYSGTPGSGKSLDCARTIYNWCRLKKLVICNFPVNTDKIRIRGRKDIRYIPNTDLDPDYLVEIAKEHFKGKKVKEDSILLIIDESQLLFNARDWAAKNRRRWTWFFTMHRHFGFFILLCAQYDRMLDRQVRSLIEYEYKHRKVSNMGWRGWFTSLMMLAPGKLFVKVRVWYPMHEKVGAEFYRCAKKYYSIYDTFALLDTEDTVQWEGAKEGIEQKFVEDSACEGTKDNKSRETDFLLESEEIINALLDMSDKMKWDGANEGAKPVPEEVPACEGTQDNKSEEAALLEEGEVMVHA